MEATQTIETATAEETSEILLLSAPAKVKLFSPDPQDVARLRAYFIESADIAIAQAASLGITIDRSKQGVGELIVRGTAEGIRTLVTILLKKKRLLAPPQTTSVMHPDSASQM